MSPLFLKSYSLLPAQPGKQQASTSVNHPVPWHTEPEENVYCLERILQHWLRYVLLLPGL